MLAAGLAFFVLKVKVRQSYSYYTHACCMRCILVGNATHVVANVLTCNTLSPPFTGGTDTAGRPIQCSYMVNAGKNTNGASCFYLLSYSKQLLNKPRAS